MQGERGELAPRWLQDLARLKWPTSELFNRGLVAHVADHGEQPVTEGGVRFQHVSGNPGEEIKMEGDLYGNGSCENHLIPDLARAGWCVVCWGVNGDALAKITGPAWAPLPQTAQAAEHVAIAVAHQIASGPSTYFGDSANAIKAFSLPEWDQYSSKRMYAVILRDKLKHNQYSANLQGHVKVKARVRPESVEGLMSRHALANGEADVGAPEALNAHPVSGGRRSMEEDLKLAEQVIKVIAQLWKRWPARLPRGERMARRGGDTPGRGRGGRDEGEVPLRLGDLAVQGTSLSPAQSRMKALWERVRAKEAVARNRPE